MRRDSSVRADLPQIKVQDKRQDGIWKIWECKEESPHQRPSQPTPSEAPGSTKFYYRTITDHNNNHNRKLLKEHLKNVDLQTAQFVHTSKKKHSGEAGHLTDMAHNGGRETNWEETGREEVLRQLEVIVEELISVIWHFHPADMSLINKMDKTF